MKEIDYKEFKELQFGNRDTRAEILKLLEERPMRVEELAKELKLHRYGVYKHLKKLGDKVVMKRKKGNYIYWGLKSKIKE